MAEIVDFVNRSWCDDPQQLILLLEPRAGHYNHCSSRRAIELGSCCLTVRRLMKKGTGVELDPADALRRAAARLHKFKPAQRHRGDNLADIQKREHRHF